MDAERGLEHAELSQLVFTGGSRRRPRTGTRMEARPLHGVRPCPPSAASLRHVPASLGAWLFILGRRGRASVDGIRGLELVV